MNGLAHVIAEGGIHYLVLGYAGFAGKGLRCHFHFEMIIARIETYVNIRIGNGGQYQRA